jgi:hypothetical protein
MSLSNPNHFAHGIATSWPPPDYTRAGWLPVPEAAKQLDVIQAWLLERLGTDGPALGGWVAPQEVARVADALRLELVACCANLKRIQDETERDRLRPVLEQLAADHQRLLAAEAAREQELAARSWYAPVADADVPSLTQRLARFAADLAAGELGLPPVQIVWFGPTPRPAGGTWGMDLEAASFWSDSSVWGYVLREAPDRIHLNAELGQRSPGDLDTTVAHECRHLQQILAATDLDGDAYAARRAWHEEDATSYGVDFAARVQRWIERNRDG